MTYQREAFKYTNELISGKLVDWWWYGELQPFHIGKYRDTEIGLCLFWIGAPAAVMTLEELIPCGVETICEIGVAGGLQEFLRPGDIIVVTEAIRDEGTSNHYLPCKVKVTSSPTLRKTLTAQLKVQKIKHHLGPVWSTDGVYRETKSKFLKFRDAGVMAVNMETSAVFALAKYRKLEAASAQVISDVLTENGWLQAFEEQSVRQSRHALIEAALNTLIQS
jgi:uridine phosphorylase